MRLLKGLLIAVVVLVVIAIGVGFALPDTAHVERSVRIESPPATVYTALNGFRQFNRWSPWAAIDPDTQYRIEGPAVGVGARQVWRSDNPAAGAGSQEILEAVPYRKIVVRLVFEGWDSDNIATYTLVPEDGGTRLTWSYDSRFGSNLLARYFGLMLDRMIGSDYEQGLASLKALVEELPQTDLTGLTVEVADVVAQPMVFISAAASADEAGALLGAAHDKLRAHLRAHELGAAAAPIAITRAYDEETRAWRFDAAMIVDRDDPPDAPGSGIQSGRTYGGLVLRATHTGAYAALEQTYAALIAWRSVAGFEDNGDSWEQYPSLPGAADAESVTYIYWPVK